MVELRLHPATRKLLDTYIAEPAHALCISGDTGAGTGTTAIMTAGHVTGSINHVIVISPEKGLIPIERIRQLYEQTRSIQHTKRCIVIDDADTMSPEAQNALLKLLEEPVRDMHFILTTHQDTQLLQTIRSRMQHIRIRPIDSTESKQLLLEHGVEESKLNQALFLASGMPSELVRLATDAEHFAAKSHLIHDARAILQSDDYVRLSILNKYTDRIRALDLLTTCGMLLRFSVLKQRNYSSADAMSVIDTVMRRIKVNGHVRTHLMDLVTKLP